MEIKALIRKLLAHPQLPEILSWLIYGLVVGAIAQVLIPGRNRFGWLSTMIIGITGAVLGGFIARYMGYVIKAGWNLPGLIASLVGAIVLLIICHLLVEILD